MGVLDKFLNVMKLNDDEMSEEDYFDEEDTDYEEEEAPSRRMIRDRSEEEDEEEVISSTRYSVEEEKPKRRDSKIASMRSRSKKAASSMAVCVIRPHTMEDAREITETLLSGCAVVLNVEGLELEIAQRIIDFASGSCFAIDGNLQKISSYIFIITPSSVDISGDFQDLISGAFDVPIEGRRF